MRFQRNEFRVCALWIGLLSGFVLFPYTLSGAQEDERTEGLPVAIFGGVITVPSGFELRATRLLGGVASFSTPPAGAQLEEGDEKFVSITIGKLTEDIAESSMQSESRTECGAFEIAINTNVSNTAVGRIYQTVLFDTDLYMMISSFDKTYWTIIARTYVPYGSTDGYTCEKGYGVKGERDQAAIPDIEFQMAQERERGQVSHSNARGLGLPSDLAGRRSQ